MASVEQLLSPWRDLLAVVLAAPVPYKGLTSLIALLVFFLLSPFHVVSNMAFVLAFACFLQLVIVNTIPTPLRFPNRQEKSPSF